MSQIESPELSAEMVQALLQSLASWDPRASVPLTLTYMEHGNKEALEAFDRMALANPASEAMLKDRYMSPSPDIEALKLLPEGTLGAEFARYILDNDLDPDLLRESAFIEAHHKRGEDVGYLVERGFQLHDLFHVLTGFDTTAIGEVKVVSFTVAQSPAPYPAMIIASRPLQMVMYQPELLPFVMDAITEGWALGRKAKSLINVKWEEFWNQPLDELRNQYGLLPSS